MSITAILIALAISFTPPAEICAQAVYRVQAQPLATPTASAGSLPIPVLRTQSTPCEVEQGDFMVTPDNCTY